MTRAARHRLLALTGAAALLAVAAAAGPAQAPRRAYLIVTTLGYAHLGGAVRPGGRAAALAGPHGSRLAAGLFLALGVGCAFGLWCSALHALPWLAALPLALALWHTLENDRALADACRREASGPGPPRRSPACWAAALAGSALFAASARRADPLLSAALFALPTAYHLASWLLFLLDCPGLPRGSPTRRRRIRRLVAWHAGAVAGALWLLQRDPQLEGLAGALFSPPIYLFFSALHVIDTAWLRRREAPPGPAGATPLPVAARAVAG